MAFYGQQIYAETLRSSNFMVDESFVGGGGQVQSSSTNFKTDSAIGDVGVGSSTSTNFQTESGYVTTSDPALTFIVPTSNVSFGQLSASATAKATTTFQVINYTSYGYAVTIHGSTPSNGGHNLTPISPAGPSQQGVEQFGLNLRANNGFAPTPPILGADPIAGTTASSFGAAATGYNTANTYHYASGDVIATAPKTSGQTNFTISYIVNASTITPGGGYAGSLTLVCTGTY